MNLGSLVYFGSNAHRTTRMSSKPTLGACSLKGKCGFVGAVRTRSPFGLIFSGCFSGTPRLRSPAWMTQPSSRSTSITGASGGRRSSPDWLSVTVGSLKDTSWPLTLALDAKCGLAHSEIVMNSSSCSSQEGRRTLGSASKPRTVGAIQWLLGGDPAIRWQVLRDLVGAAERIVE